MDVKKPRLVVYRAGTDERVGFLEYPLSWQASFVDSADTALELEYSILAPGGELLNQAIGRGLDIAVQLPDGEKWVEPIGGRFCLMNRKRDDENPQQIVKLTCPSYSRLLAFAAVVDWSGEFGTEKRYYEQATPGKIMADLIDQAHRRGVLQTITYDFTAATDSNGRAWTGSPLSGVSFEVGASLQAVLTALAEGGYCQWGMVGRTLSMWNIDTISPRLDQMPEPVWLHAGTDITSAATDESIENLVSRALVRGSGDICFKLDNPEAPTPWGKTEKYYKMEGVGNEGTVRAMAHAELDKTTRPAKEITKQLVFPARFFPLIDYWPGAWIKAETTPATHEPARVRQITLTWDSDGLGGSVILGDRFLESQVATARNLQKLTGGATVGGNGTSATMDLTPDPGRPTRLVVGSQAFTDEYGRARASVTCHWNEGMLNGGEGQYILEGRNITADGEDAPWQSMGIYTAPQAEIASLPAGTVWEFRVAGYNGARTSPWCVSERITLARKNGAGNLPPVAGHLTSSKGIALIKYDGKVQSPTGVAVGLPADFDRIEAAITTTPSAPPYSAAVVSAVAVPATLALQASKGTQVWGWSRLVDTSGNKTRWVATTPPSVTVRGITAPDLEAGTVTANNVDAGSVTAAIAEFVQATVGNLYGSSAQFVKAIVDNLTANTAVLNTLWSDIIRGRYIEASQIVGDIVRANDLYVGGVKINPECLRGQGTINNPVDYGSTSMDGSSFDVGSSRLGSDELSVGAVKINSWGNGWIPRCDAERFATEMLSLGEQNGDSISGRYSISYDSWQGVYCNTTFKAGGLASESTIYASGAVMASDFVKNSSRASKYDPEPVRDVTRILEVEPVAYRPRVLVDEWREQFVEAGPSRLLKPLPERQAGWVAEDLEAAGLGIFVKHNQDGEILGVEYDAIPVALWQVLRKQQKQIEALERRIAAAESGVRS